MSDPGWTFTSLKHYIISLLNERDKRYEQRFRAQQEAISKTEKASELRFQSVNEFRNTLADQAKSFASSEALNNLRDRVDKLENILSALKGEDSGGLSLKNESRANISILIAVMSAIIGIVVFLMRFAK
jgi:hypothetical protein